MSQYFLLLSASTWARRALAWAASRACWELFRVRCRVPVPESRNPVPGPRGRRTTAPWRPPPAAFRPGSWTTRSGRIVESAPALWTCSRKSTCLSIPDASTTRRSCTSPHCPRALLERRADSRACVERISWASDSRASWSCCASWPYCSRRSRSSSATCCCTAVSFSATGASARSTFPSWLRDSPSSRFWMLRRRRSASAAANWALTSERRDETASKSSSSAWCAAAERKVGGGGTGKGAHQQHQQGKNQGESIHILTVACPCDNLGQRQSGGCDVRTVQPALPGTAAGRSAARCG